MSLSDRLMAGGGSDLEERLAVGARYGLLVGLLMSSTSLIFYAVMPLPLNLVLAWIGGGIVEIVLAGVVLALLAGNAGQTFDTEG